MRNAFIQELVALARQHSQIALLVGDIGYSVIEPFADEFPERFINVGVAEQNMTGLAAGMASEGYHVFTYSIANFPTFRCAEQIRNDVAYHNLAVTIVSVGGGVAYGTLGYSHHAVQDYALIRTMPNMLIAAPGDPMEVRACLHYLVKNPGPSYLRLGKTGETNYHTMPPCVNPGDWLPVRQGSNKSALLSTGAALQTAMEYIKKENFKQHSVFAMPLWSMKVKREQAIFLNRFNTILTLEDHLQDGGFGSWLLEAQALNRPLNCEITTIALSQEVCETVGSQSMLHKLGGLLP